MKLGPCDLHNGSFSNSIIFLIRPVLHFTDNYSPLCFKTDWSTVKSVLGTVQKYSQSWVKSLHHYTNIKSSRYLHSDFATSSCDASREQLIGLQFTLQRQNIVLLQLIVCWRGSLLVRLIVARRAREGQETRGEGEGAGEEIQHHSSLELKH